MGKAAAPFPRCPQALVSQILPGCSGPRGRRGSVPPQGLGRGSPLPQPPPAGTAALGVLGQDQSPALVAMERAVRVLGRAAKSPKKALSDLFQLSGIVAHPQPPSLPTLGSQPVVGRCSLGRAGPSWWHWWGTGGTGRCWWHRRGCATPLPPPPLRPPAARGRHNNTASTRKCPRPLPWRRGAACPGPALPGGRRPRESPSPVPGARCPEPSRRTPCSQGRLGWGPAVWCPRPAPVPP